MNELDAESCAAHIAAHRASDIRLDGHALARHTPDEATGYAIQRRAGELIAQDGGGEVTGYKLGMTSPALRAQFGITEPLYGAMHAAGCVANGDRLAVNGAMRPLALECEVALTMARDLETPDRPHDLASVAAAIATFHVAIEVVENRFIGLDQLSPWIIVADGVLHRGYAIGPAVSPSRATGTLAGDLTHNGTVITTGRSDGLWGGGPIEAVTWLASKLNANGHLLRAGDVILCGSLGPAAWLPPDATGDVVATIPELGSVKFQLT
jgi:2-keto-4-pentenoate hydratase